MDTRIGSRKRTRDFSEIRRKRVKNNERLKEMLNNGEKILMKDEGYEILEIDGFKRYLGTVFTAVFDDLEKAIKAKENDNYDMNGCVKLNDDGNDILLKDGYLLNLNRMLFGMPDGSIESSEQMTYKIGEKTHYIRRLDSEPFWFVFYKPRLIDSRGRLRKYKRLGKSRKSGKK